MAATDRRYPRLKHTHSGSDLDFGVLTLGDMLYFDGTDVVGTAGELAWLPANDSLQLAVNHSIDWLDAAATPIELLTFADSVLADPNAADVQLLMFAEDLDATTTFTDSSQNNAASSVIGEAQIDTDQSRFGNSSILFDGTGDQVIMPSISAFDIGSQDFTIEYSVRHAGTVAGTQTHMIRWDKQAPTGTIDWFAWNNGTTFQLFLSEDGLGFSTISIAGFFTGEEDEWVDVAISRVGTDIFILKNGVHQLTFDATGFTFNDGGDPIRFGAAYDTQLFGLNGWIDNVRLTVGTGRYTTTSYTVVDFSAGAIPRRFKVGSLTEVLVLQAANATLSSDLEVTGNLTLVGGTANGSLYLFEKGAASVDVSNQGQLWVRDDVPNVLVYTDENGTDFDLTAPGAGLGGTVTDSVLRYNGTAFVEETRVRVSAAGVLTIVDGTGSDSVSTVHDGTNLVTSSVGTAAWVINPLVDGPNVNAQEVGFRGSPLITQNGDFTLELTNAGRTIRKSSGGAGETITIPANGAVAFPIGTMIGFQNDGGGDLTIAITTDTLTGTDGVTGSRTLGDNHTAVIQKVAATEWKYAASDL